jgi:hypothetical protein
MKLININHFNDQYEFFKQVITMIFKNHVFSLHLTGFFKNSNNILKKKQVIHIHTHK